MNIIRDNGLEYCSQKHKFIPTKIQPDLFCHCPQLCKNKLPKEKWKDLFDQFHKIADQNAQNRFLQNHIMIKAVHRGKLQSDSSPSQVKRRVTCRYKIPILDSDQSLEMLVDKRASDTVEVCQKAFMNIFALTEKRIRVQRERCIEYMMPDYYIKKTTDYSKIFKDQFDQLNTDGGDEQPLDLSKHAERSFELSPAQLDEFAQMLGIPKEAVTQEMIRKYEEMVKRNIEKQKKGQARKRKSSNDVQTMSGIAKHVIGLNDNSGVIPSQTLNNGDITITPVRNKTESYSGGITITPVKRKPDRQPPSLVDQEHFMQVDSFFQNQLWQLELFKGDENQQD